MKHALLSSMVAILLIGCTSTIVKNQETEIPTTQHGISKEADALMAVDQVEASKEYQKERMDFGRVFKNGEIFFGGKKRGTYDDKRIYLSYEGDIYSFEYDDIEKLDFHPMSEEFESVVYYGDLVINLPHEWNPKILYKCTGPLKEGRAYKACKTNGKDQISQYEFGGKFRQFSTGGGFPVGWHYLDIRNIDGDVIIFENIVGAVMDIDPSFSPYEAYHLYNNLLQEGLTKDVDLGVDLKDGYIQTEDQAQQITKMLESRYKDYRETLESETYLNSVKEKQGFKESMRQWSSLMKSFRIEK